MVSIISIMNVVRLDVVIVPTCHVLIVFISMWLLLQCMEKLMRIEYEKLFFDVLLPGLTKFYCRNIYKTIKQLNHACYHIFQILVLSRQFLCNSLYLFVLIIVITAPAIVHIT